MASTLAVTVPNHPSRNFLSSRVSRHRTATKSRIFLKIRHLRAGTGRKAPIAGIALVDRRRRAGSGKIQQALVETAIAFDHRNCPIAHVSGPAIHNAV